MGEYELQVNYITQKDSVNDTPFEDADWSTGKESYSSAPPSPPTFSGGDPFDDIFSPKYEHKEDYKPPEVDASINADSPLDMPIVEKNTPNYSSQVVPPPFVEEKKDNHDQGDDWLFSDRFTDKKETPPPSIDNNLNQQVDNNSPYESVNIPPDTLFADDDKSTGQTKIFGSKDTASIENEINLFPEQQTTNDDAFKKENRHPTHHNDQQFTESTYDNEEKQGADVPPPPAKPNLHTSPYEKEQRPLEQQQDQLFEALFKGAGIDTKQHKTRPSKEQAFLMGVILRDMLQGTMELLRSRTEIKAHMRLGEGDKTMISVAHNNPLKFLPSVDHVMSQLILTENSNNPAYMPLADAIKESFNDLKAHQLALNMSIQEALSSTIRDYFSPLNLQRKLEKSSPISSKIPWQKNAKLWKLFEETYEDIEEEASETFQLVLEKKIADAYHANMTKLRQ